MTPEIEKRRRQLEQVIMLYAEEPDPAVYQLYRSLSEAYRESAVRSERARAVRVRRKASSQPSLAAPPSK